ncbi:MAG: galactose mutarotase [Bacteroidales bacterium]|nr:galactose mutarotase [Bacteroidales bacterium]
MNIFRNLILGAGLVTIGLTACTSAGGQLTVSGLDPAKFDTTINNKKVQLFVLKNQKMEVCVTNYGGRVVSISVPDKDGQPTDVVLGYDNIAQYADSVNNASDFGAAIGRYANRINQGIITIEGQQIQLPKNNYGHCLHGGPDGWQYKVYEAVEADAGHLRLLCKSPDGDAGFPGAVEAYVTYTLTEDNKLEIAYEATCDKATVINLTNHSYFNLSGNPAEHTVTDDVLYINSLEYTPVDSTFMTTGEIVPVAGTPFDFTLAKRIGDGIDADDEQIRNGHGYDHNWVLATGGSIEALAAELWCPASGISLKVYTDEPGIQIYAGNFLDGTVTGKKGVRYQRRTAICLETQHYPDTPNKPQWPTAVLRPGERYSSHCIFAFGVK